MRKWLNSESLFVNSESTSDSQASGVIARTNIVRTWQSTIAFFLDCFAKARNDNKVYSPLTTHNSLVKAIAFTLAETLVVMGIIGVVAALTIPNLNQSTGDRERVAKVRKIYANLNDAYGRATATYGPIMTWFINDTTEEAKTERFAKRLTQFMKVSKDCGIGTGEGCFLQKDGKFSDGTGDPDSPYNWDSDYKVLLADGASLNLFVGTMPQITVDIDGPKGSAIWNKELFAFSIDSNDELFPVGYNYSNSQLITNCFTPSNAIAGNCTGWVIQTGNMDYLKATNGKCPNGTMLSWENTSCK